jgi:hypothetical protein
MKFVMHVPHVISDVVTKWRKRIRCCDVVTTLDEQYRAVTTAKHTVCYNFQKIHPFIFSLLLQCSTGWYCSTPKHCSMVLWLRYSTGSVSPSGMFNCYIF